MHNVGHCNKKIHQRRAQNAPGRGLLAFLAAQNIMNKIITPGAKMRPVVSLLRFIIAARVTSITATAALVAGGKGYWLCWRQLWHWWCWCRRCRWCCNWCWLRRCCHRRWRPLCHHSCWSVVLSFVPSACRRSCCRPLCWCSLCRCSS